MSSAEGGPRPRRRELSLDDYFAGIRTRDRGVLGRAISLIESSAPAHEQLAAELLQRLRPHAGGAHRVGISGPPGAGKSTLIEALGTYLTGSGHRVAVLAVDPSSQRSGGSILGDKTRMHRLATDPNAFIRPSPTSGSLGGVGRKTRDVLLLCEAAGFDRVIVETVGVGQSETLVADMVDSFLMVLLAGAGDELQGIKRGVLEHVDVLAVNKADGENSVHAERARSEYASAISLLRPRTPGWKVPTVTCSAREARGIEPLWRELERHFAHLQRTGAFEQRRAAQELGSLWQAVEAELRARSRRHPGAPALLLELARAVRAGEITETQAARNVLSALGEY